MSIERERFETIRAKHGAHASWAVWREAAPTDKPKAHVGDLSVLDLEANPELLDTLKPEVVLLGLNASTRDMRATPWANFHDSSPRANDFKIRYALQGTPYWGAYMTDVLVGHHETDSSKVRSRVAHEPEWVEAQVARLKNELTDLATPSPLLVALGGDAYSLASTHLPGYRIVKVAHYAHYVSREKYREEVLRVLDRAVLREAG